MTGRRGADRRPAGTRWSPAPTQGTDTLRATREQDIPSNRVKVCVNPDLSPSARSAHGKRIIGSRRADEIRGTPRLGRDQGPVAATTGSISRAGGRDRVNCGGGRDRVIVRRGDRNDRIAASCERVVRR